MTPEQRAQRIKDAAGRLGFDRVGIAPAGPIARGAFLQEWLRRGYAGGMAYLSRNSHARLDPGFLLPGARTIIVTASLYRPAAPPAEPPPVSSGTEPRGRIARYAWGNDYHRVLRARMRNFAAVLRDELDEPFRSRVCVDTAPILERELAAAAGIGWIGKNTLVVHERLGSYFFLAELITTIDATPDEPATDHCGSCRRCLDACPTGAFPQPHVMDAGRCISYLTIEHRDAIPAELHAAMGDWVYGCDVCQEVCPFNRNAPPTQDPEFAVHPPAPAIPLIDMQQWSDDDYAQRLAHSAMTRATPAMLRRNAAIAAANAQRTDPPPEENR